MPVEIFELVIVMLIAILALHWVAGQLNWPPSVALLLGGSALAFIPGIPAVRLDPKLVLVLFLPPLLMDSAWFTAVAHFRRHFIGILALAIGAVIFTTAVVATVTHLLMPNLPWAACVALGAIVSPPDAVSARAVLQRVRLPRRLTTLLEGESLLNDAAGLVLFRFAVAIAMGGHFIPGAGALAFTLLAVGGIAVGTAVGAVWLFIIRRLHEEFLIVTTSCVTCWTAYIIGERLHVSGVIATVTVGLILGWYQHVALSASARMTGMAFWRVMIFLLEASVFILIGFSLRGVLHRIGPDRIFTHMLGPLLGIVLAITIARFVWVFASDLVILTLNRLLLTRHRPLGWRQSAVMGWAGMRGVVTLAVALTLPDSIPGRDFMLVTAFGTILITVLIQGSTLGLIIRATGLHKTSVNEAPMDILQTEAFMVQAQLATVEKLAHDDTGKLVHPRLLDSYVRRARAVAEFTGTLEQRQTAIGTHYGIIIEAIRTARSELVRLHRAEQIDDETLRNLERDLDLEELAAIAARNY